MTPSVTFLVSVSKHLAKWIWNWVGEIWEEFGRRDKYNQTIMDEILKGITYFIFRRQFLGRMISLSLALSGGCV